jgi:hypothetical protein
MKADNHILYNILYNVLMILVRQCHHKGGKREADQRYHFVLVLEDGVTIFAR